MMACGPALAQLVDCRAPAAAPYVVFLSEPQFSPNAFGSRADMLRFFDRLHEHLDQRRDLEMAGLEKVEFSVARCEKRIPAIDGSDFTSDVVRSLYGRKVVVEVWGSLDGRKVGNKLQPSAQINYLVVPIRQGVGAGAGKVPGIHRFNYPDRDVVASDFLDLVSNADLHAFVMAAIGMTAFDGNDFSLAHQMLCKAGARLARTEAGLVAAPQTKVQGEGIRDLRVFLLKIAGQAITEARRDAKAAPPFARLHDPADPCSGRGGPQ